MAVPVEAIERVVDDLQTIVDQVSRYREVDLSIDAAIRAYERAISELKKVMHDYGKVKP